MGMAHNSYMVLFGGKDGTWSELYESMTEKEKWGIM